MGIISRYDVTVGCTDGHDASVVFVCGRDVIYLSVGGRDVTMVFVQWQLCIASRMPLASPWQQDRDAYKDSHQPNCHHDYCDDCPPVCSLKHAIYVKERKSRY